MNTEDIIVYLSGGISIYYEEDLAWALLEH